MTEIPVSERMIEAGEIEFMRRVRNESHRAMGARIYRAMHQAHLDEEAEATAERIKARE